MSVLMEQHQAHVDRRARMGMPVFARRRVREVVAALPDSTKRREPEAWGCPVNLMGPASPRLVIKLVALKHMVAPSTMLGPSRATHLVAARGEAIGLVYTHCRAMSLPEMGRLFGDRDHTTILHALRKLRLGGSNYYRRKVIPANNDLPHSGADPGKTTGATLANQST